MAIYCKVCKKTALSKPGICHTCCNKLGVVAMPEATRPPRGCMRCNGMKFVRVIPREHTVALEGYLRQQAAPMALTYGPRHVESGLLTDGGIAAPDIKEGFGILETYVCLGCDFVEWYCQSATEIPIGPEYMTELIDFTPESPYR